MEDNLPVIIGVADVLDRTDDLSQAKETLTLINDALKAAEKDTGVTQLIAKLEQINIVNVFSWPYTDIIGDFSKLLPKKSNRRLCHGPVGGESPLRFINQMAQDIAHGKYEFGAVCGGEAQRSAMKALRAGRIPNHWPKPDLTQLKTDLRDWVTDYAKQYGLTSPTAVYPFYENNMYGKYGQDYEGMMAESSHIWHNFSKVAAQNPFAWIQSEKSEEEIRTVDPNNRMIAFPYPKFMVANNSVNSSAAVIMTSVKQAQKLGVPKEKWIFVGAGAAANEPEDFLKRDNYHHSASMETVLKKVLEFNAIEVQDLEYTELYSCFPCIPKMARRILGMQVDHTMTVIGGLTFAGAALNNYMTAATTGMVRKLRQKGGKGLLYGNGEFVTKNHALALSTTPFDLHTVLQDYDVQKAADKLRKSVPELLEKYEGPATLETYSVIYDRKGPQNPVVIGRTPDQKRFLSHVPLWDKQALEVLLQPKESLVGKKGWVVHKKGENRWHFSKAVSAKDPDKQHVFLSKESELITLERFGKNIAVITLNRPAKKNAINAEMTRLLYNYVQETERNPAIEAVILRSSNTEVFCAGADLKVVSEGQMATLFHPQGGFGGFVKTERKKPWIAAVQGWALGGGLEFSLACDMIICDRETQFGLPEVSRGIFAAAGGVIRLPRSLPEKIAREMVATGTPVSAEKALHFGMVNKVTDGANVFTEALAMARKITENAPLAVEKALEIAKRSHDFSEEELWQLNDKLMEDLMHSADAKEGSKAFLEKRKPKWKGV